MASGPPRWNANRIAPAITPDTAADAPIIGSSSPKWVSEMQGAPATAVTAKKPRKRSVPNRRATARGKRQEPDRIHRQVKDIAMKERVGDEGPDRAPKPPGMMVWRARDHSAPE